MRLWRIIRRRNILMCERASMVRFVDRAVFSRNPEMRRKGAKKREEKTLRFFAPLRRILIC